MTGHVILRADSGALKGVSVNLSDKEFELVNLYAQQQGVSIEDAFYSLFSEGLEMRVLSRVGQGVVRQIR